MVDYTNFFENLSFVSNNNDSEMYILDNFIAPEIIKVLNIKPSFNIEFKNYKFNKHLGLSLRCKNNPKCLFSVELISVNNRWTLSPDKFKMNFCCNCSAKRINLSPSSKRSRRKNTFYQKAYNLHDMIKEVDFSFYQLITEDILLDILIELFKSKRLKIPCLNVISHSDGGGFINKLYIVCNCGNCDLKISIRRNSIRDSWKLHESSNLKNYECRCVQIIDTGLNTKPTVDLKLNDRIGNEATEPLLKKQCIDITCESVKSLPKNTKVSINNKFVDLESVFTNAKITFDSQEMHSNNDAKNKIFSYFANLSVDISCFSPAFIRKKNHTFHKIYFYCFGKKVRLCKKNCTFKVALKRVDKSFTFVCDLKDFNSNFCCKCDPVLKSFKFNSNENIKPENELELKENVYVEDISVEDAPLEISSLEDIPMENLFKCFEIVLNQSKNSCSGLLDYSKNILQKVFPDKKFNLNCKFPHISPSFNFFIKCSCLNIGYKLKCPFKVTFRRDIETGIFGYCSDQRFTCLECTCKDNLNKNGLKAIFKINFEYIENDFLNDSKHLNANDVLLNNYNKLMSNYKISNQEEEGVVSKEIRNGYYDFFSTFEFKIPDFGSSIEYIRSLLLPKLISNNIIRDFKINIIPQKPKSRAVFIGCNCQLRMKYSKTSSSTYKLDESFDNCFVCECMEGDCFKRIKTTSDIQYYLEKKDTVQETENSSPDVDYIDFVSNEKKKSSESKKNKPITPIHDPNYCEWCLDLRLMEKSINEMLNNKISCSLSPLVEEKS